MKRKKFQFVFILFFGVLFNACSTKYEGQYENFFSNQKGWIPINAYDKDFYQGNYE